MDRVECRLDRGWSWVVAFACCFSSLILAGIFRTSGVLFVAFISDFGVTREEASWPMVLCISVLNLTGPFSGVLARKFGGRPVIITGAVVAALGISACYLTTSLKVITALFGGVFGVGYGFMNTIMPGILNAYFLNLRATANGIANSGSCIGSIILPIAFEHFISTYGLSGCFLLTGGIVLHITIAGALMRPPPWLTNEVARMDCEKAVSKRGFDLLKHNPELETSKACSLLGVKSRSDYMDLVSTGGAFSSGINSEKSDLTHSNPNKCIDIPSGNNEYLSSVSRTTCPIVKKHTVQSDNNEQLPRASSSTITKEQHSDEHLPSASNTIELHIAKALVQPEDNEHLQSVSSSVGSARKQHRNEPLQSVSNHVEIANEQQSNEHLQSASSTGDSNITKAIVQSDDTKSLQRGPSATGPLAKTTVQPDNDENLQSTATSNKTSRWLCPASGCDPFLNQCQDIASPFKSVLTCPMFYVTAVTNVTFYFLYHMYVVIIVDYSLDTEVEEGSTKYILFAFSLADLFGRLCLGWITDRQLVSRTRFVMGCMTLIGVVFFLFPFAKGYWPLVAVSCGYGLLLGCTMVVFPILLVDFLGIELHSVSYGCMCFMNGFASFGRPFLIGYFRDNVGSYASMFYVLGSISVLASGLWLLEGLFQKKQE